MTSDFLLLGNLVATFFWGLSPFYSAAMRATSGGNASPGLGQKAPRHAPCPRPPSPLARGPSRTGPRGRAGFGSARALLLPASRELPPGTKCLEPSWLKHQRARRVRALHPQQRKGRAAGVVSCSGFVSARSRARGPGGRARRRRWSARRRRRSARSTALRGRIRAQNGLRSGCTSGMEGGLSKALTPGLRALERAQLKFLNPLPIPTAPPNGHPNQRP